MAQVKLKDHVVVCGWSSTAAGIISELYAEHGNDRWQVVLIDEKLESSPVDDPYVYFVQGDPTSDETLERADIGSACTALVLADWTIPDLSLRDAKTTLITMAIEDHNGDVYTVVELMRPENRRHLERANADEAVCVTDLSKRLLVHAAMNHSLSRFFTDILAFDEGSEIYRVDLPSVLAGETFRSLLVRLNSERQALLVAVERNGQLHTNPSGRFVLEPEDALFLIARTRPKELEKLAD